MSTPLASSTLQTLDRAIEVPSYDRSAVSIGIVHFGVGGFHRSHQALYIDDLLCHGEAHDWGICGVGLLPGDQAMHEALTSQDCLYTVVTRHSSGEVSARVVGSIIEYLYAPDDPEQVLTVLADPRVRVVSLTVTEGGYSLDAVTGEFDPSSATIRAEIVDPGPPSTVFGYLLEGLRRRRENGLRPFTVMSCDNIAHNGVVARASLCAYAGLVDPDLAEWIRQAVPFPNSMVDRITPATTPKTSRTFGVSLESRMRGLSSPNRSGSGYSKMNFPVAVRRSSVLVCR